MILVKIRNKLQEFNSWNDFSITESAKVFGQCLTIELFDHRTFVD